MSRLMRAVWNRQRLSGEKRNAGLSLIELVCTIAIMSIVMGGIAGAMIISTKTYNKGKTESDLQQQAQLIVSDISDLVIDSKEASWDGSSGNLVIKRDVDDFYVIKYSAADGTLTYGKSTGTVAPTDTEMEPLADGVTSFVPDVSDFKSTRTIKLSMGVEGVVSGVTKSYSGKFAISSRNGDMDAIDNNRIVTELVLSMPTAIVLEPLESYDFTATARSSIGTVDVEMSIDGSANPLETDKGSKLEKLAGSKSAWTLTISKEEDTDFIVVTTATATSRTGVLLATKQARTEIHIRRVSGINPYDDTSSSHDLMIYDEVVASGHLSAQLLDPKVNVPKSTSDEGLYSRYWKKGAKFVIPVLPKVEGTHLDNESTAVSAAADDKYVDPRMLNFRVVGRAAGDTGMPKDEINGRPASDYASLSVIRPHSGSSYVILTLKQDMTYGQCIGIAVMAAHPYGDYIQNATLACTDTLTNVRQLDYSVTKNAESNLDRVVDPALAANRSSVTNPDGKLRRYGNGTSGPSSDAKMWALYLATMYDRPKDGSDKFVPNPGLWRGSQDELVHGVGGGSLVGVLKNDYISQRGSDDGNFGVSKEFRFRRAADPADDPGSWSDWIANSYDTAESDAVKLRGDSLALDPASDMILEVRFFAYDKSKVPAGNRANFDDSTQRTWPSADVVNNPDKAGEYSISTFVPHVRVPFEVSVSGGSTFTTTSYGDFEGSIGTPYEISAGSTCDFKYKANQDDAISMQMSIEHNTIVNKNFVMHIEQYDSATDSWSPVGDSSPSVGKSAQRLEQNDYGRYTFSDPGMYRATPEVMDVMHRAVTDGHVIGTNEGDSGHVDINTCQYYYFDVQ